MEINPWVAVLIATSVAIITHGHHWLKVWVEMKSQREKPKNTNPSQSPATTAQTENHGEIDQAEINRRMPRRMLLSARFWVATTRVLVSWAALMLMLYGSADPSPATAGTVFLCGFLVCTVLMLRLPD